jgi:hypothetical protein
MKRFLAAALASGAVLVAVGSGCGKSLNTGEEIDAPHDLHDPASCSSDQLIRWQFLQPQPLASQAVDVLFVVDTSDSLWNERIAIAHCFPEFLEKLPAGTDYRVAVMEAHGGDSDYAGRLYSAPGVPLVLGPGAAGSEDEAIEENLEHSLGTTACDPGPSHGEAGLYSFLRSLDKDRSNEIKGQGFFRDNAALSVVFVSDENDICFPPQLHGYTNWPDYVKNTDGSEMVAYQKYCLNADGSEHVTPNQVLASLMNFKPQVPVSVGAFIHTDPNKVFRFPWVEDAIGHGYLEMTQLAAPNSIATDLSSTDYASTLVQLASLPHGLSQLRHQFPLPSGPPFLASTIHATIDGKPVTAHFDASTGAVVIDGTDLGHAGSVVNVEACRVLDGPPPTGE